MTHLEECKYFVWQILEEKQLGTYYSEDLIGEVFDLFHRRFYNSYKLALFAVDSLIYYHQFLRSGKAAF